MPTVIGLIVLALLVKAVQQVAPADISSSAYWLFLYVPLAIGAVVWWSSKEWPEGPLGALGVAIAGLVVGSVFFVVDVLIGRSKHPAASDLDAALNSGLGFYFTLVTFAVTLVALAGSARNAVARKRTSGGA